MDGAEHPLSAALPDEEDRHVERARPEEVSDGEVVVLHADGGDGGDELRERRREADEESADDTTCPEGEPAEFTTFHSDGRSVYVWNLDP